MAAEQFRGVLLTSVHHDERDLAEKSLPGATLLDEEFSERVAEQHADCVVLSPNIFDRFPEEALEKMPKLAAIVTRSVGYDHLPLKWAKKNGVSAYNLGDYSSRSVAEHTLGLMFALLRKLPQSACRTNTASQHKEHGSWDRTDLGGTSIQNIKVGLIGCGGIGAETARLLCALGATVLGFDVKRNEELSKLEHFSFVDDMDDLLRQSQLLSMHVPLNDKTRNLLSKEKLALLPGNALLVNASRGGTVDQDAVLEALRKGQLGGYAADVLPGEPKPPHLEKFGGLPNVLLTPHTAGFDNLASETRYKRLAEIIKGELDKKPVQKYRLTE